MGQRQAPRRGRGEPGTTPWPLLLLVGGCVVMVALLGRHVLSLGSGAQAPRENVAPGPGRAGPADPRPAPKPPPRRAAPSPSAPTGPAPVSLGAGIFTAAAPSSTSRPDGAARCGGCNVVLITMCSLRKDHVGIYTHDESLAPAVSGVAAGGYRFERAYAASNFTLAGLTAVLTGSFASSTGVTGWDKGLTADVTTLPEVLGYYGYTTVAFTTDAPSGFRPDYGLDRGFQSLTIDSPARATPDGRHQDTGDEVARGQTADPVVAWLETPREEPFFLMFHTRTAHFPFVISDGGADRDQTGMTRLLWEAGQQAEAERNNNQAMPGMAGGTAQEGVVSFAGPDPLQIQVEALGEPAIAVWKQHYRAAVNRMDLDVARVLDALTAAGLQDDTIVVMVADHGESLNDHGELLHGNGFYDSVINVPLLIRVPGMPGRTDSIPALVSHVDLMPTLLELVGARPPAGIDGVSFVPLLTGEVEQVRGTALSEGGVARQGGRVLPGAVVSPPFTLLRQERGCDASSGGRSQGRAPCLYDVSTDPDQTHNLAPAQPQTVRELLTRWDGHRAQRQNQGRSLQLDPELVEALQTTGYDFRLAPP